MKTATLTTWYGKASTYVLAHKIISAVALVVILGGGWFTYSKLTAAGVTTSYVLGTAAKGTIVASVSATGQVSAEDQIDIKPKATGEIVWVGVSAGQSVRAGQALMSVDSTDAKRAVASAQKSFDAAKLQYQKDSAQAPISHQNNLDDLQTSQENLATTYNDTFNDLSDTYLGLPAIMTGAQNALYGNDFDTQHSQWNMDVLSNLFTNQDVTSMLAFKASAQSDYAAARTAYNNSLLSYKNLSRSSSTSTVETSLSQTTTMITAVAQALQSELNFMGSVSDLAQTYNIKLPSAFSTVQSSTRGYLSTANGNLSTLLSQSKAITSAKQAITTAQQNLQLDAVGNQDGSDPISLQIEKNNLDKQEQDLLQQESDLSDYTVVAPFDGMLASVGAKVGDTAGGTSVATIITNRQIAQLSLNEVDASKIKLGDKATLTFDAIDGLSLTGTIVEIDPVGTVSQGVVSYNVKVAFDSQDSRVKPGMTVNATVQSAVHQDVLTVPSSAVKTTGGTSYVLVFTPPLTETGGTQGVVSKVAPQQVPVTTGISSDTDVEILSGLTEGEQIVTRTISGTTSTTAAASAARTTGAAGRAGAGGFGGGAAIRL